MFWGPGVNIFFYLSRNEKEIAHMVLLIKSTGGKGSNKNQKKLSLVNNKKQ